jgi:hypothetical protein
LLASVHPFLYFYFLSYLRNLFSTNIKARFRKKYYLFIHSFHQGWSQGRGIRGQDQGQGHDRRGQDQGQVHDCQGQDQGQVHDLRGQDQGQDLKLQGQFGNFEANDKATVVEARHNQRMLNLEHLRPTVLQHFANPF